MNKVVYKLSCNQWLQLLLKNLTWLYIKNLIVKLHILYVFNTHVKFRVNKILFTILSITFFMDNFRLTKLEI